MYEDIIWYKIELVQEKICRNTERNRCGQARETGDMIISSIDPEQNNNDRYRRSLQEQEDHVV